MKESKVIRLFKGEITRLLHKYKIEDEIRRISYVRLPLDYLHSASVHSVLNDNYHHGCRTIVGLNFTKLTKYNRRDIVKIACHEFGHILQRRILSPDEWPLLYKEHLKYQKISPYSKSLSEAQCEAFVLHEHRTLVSKLRQPRGARRSREYKEVISQLLETIQ